MKYSIFITTAILIAVVLKPIASFSQNQAEIGQQVPNFHIDNVVNSDKSEFDLNDLKGKLLILDFGGINCSSCVRALPQYDSLQQKYGDKVKFIWVTHDTKENLADFLKNNKMGQQAKHIAMVAKDSILTNYFKHFYIPHEVWINGNGIVRAATSDHYVDAVHIQEMLAGTTRKWPVKREAQWGFLDTGFSSLNYRNFQEIPIPQTFYSSAFTSHIENNFMAGSSMSKDTIKHINTIHLMNGSIKRLYTWAFLRNTGSLFGFTNSSGGSGTILSFMDDYPILKENSHFLIKVKDPTSVDFNGIGYKEEWDELHTFCYEIRFSENLPIKQIRAKIFQDLDFYFNFKSHIVDTNINCWKIVKLNSKVRTPKPNTKNSYTIRDFVDGLNALNGVPPTIIQEHLTGKQLSEKYFLTDKESDILFRQSSSSYPQLKSVFNKMGLDLLRTKYKTQVFVLSDGTKNTTNN